MCRNEGGPVVSGQTIPTPAPTATTAGTPTPIAGAVPTMNQWGLIATTVMTGLFGLLTVRRGFKINEK